MNIDNALMDMAKEMDGVGYSGKDITDAGHVMGAFAAMVSGDMEALNHFMCKVAMRYDLKFKPMKNIEEEPILRNPAKWSLSA